MVLTPNAVKHREYFGLVCMATATLATLAAITAMFLLWKIALAAILIAGASFIAGAVTLISIPDLVRDQLLPSAT